MILSLRQIKSRIRGIENVKKVTHAMEMISVAKYRNTENRLLSRKQYSEKIEELLKELLAASNVPAHPLLNQRPEKQKIALCVITSDTGLCSLYNANVIRQAEQFINRHGREKVVLYTLGKKGFSYFKNRNFNIRQAYISVNGRFSDDFGARLCSDLSGVFLSGEVDEVYLAYTIFLSPARHSAAIQKFLNIDIPAGKKIECIFDPDIKGIMEKLIPEYLLNKIKSVLLDAFASEHASRMMAMGEATSNARELLLGLVLMRNKVRQANITKELIEIVSSAEVLR